MKSKERVRSKFKLQKINRSVVKESLIVSQLFKIIQSRSVDTVGIYYPINQEPDISSLLRLIINKNLALPKVDYDKNEMFFCQYRLFDNLKVAKFSILEPINFCLVVPDIILVPGIAFDQQGFRLGYGHGFFDKYFFSYGKDVIKIGVCFHDNLVVKLPSNCYDVKMDYIITDQILLKVC